MSGIEDKTSLMSASLRSFLWQRIVELLGFAICMVSLCLLLVLITANKNDPSFNTASVQEIQNWFGSAGAHVAAGLYQMFGLPAFGFSLAPFIWGVRLITDKRFHRWKWRLPVLFISVLLLSMAAGGMFDATVTDSRGGLVGRYMVAALIPLLADMNLPDNLSVRQFIGSMAAALGTFAFLWASALSKRPWTGLVVVPRFLRVISQRVTNGLRRRTEKKAEAQKLDPKSKRQKTTSKADKNARREPVLMQTGQSEAVTDKAAASALAAKKVQSSFDFEGNNTFKLPPFEIAEDPFENKSRFGAGCPGTECSTAETGVK